MSKYSVVKELIKIANTLDESGFIKEASAIDKVAKKIVISQVDAETYQKDISNYQTLINNAKAAKSDGDKQTALQDATDQYNGVLNSMWSRYSPEQKQAWRAQSNRIRNEAGLGEGATGAPGFANLAATNDFTKEMKDAVDILLGPTTQKKIDDYMASNTPDKNPWKQFFDPIIANLTARNLFNDRVKDYLQRSYSIMLAKHGRSSSIDPLGSSL